MARPSPRTATRRDSSPLGCCLLEDNFEASSPYAAPTPSTGIDYKTTTILLDGRRVKLQLWDTSGQGRFCTIFRSYSRGAQGVILVYDIANRWSFDGIDRWIKEIDEHAPGVPKILVGNRLHLAFKRQVPTEQAQAYAERLGVTFFEVSPLCNFNITESFTELARTVLLRHGMDRLWRPSKELDTRASDVSGAVGEVTPDTLGLSPQTEVRRLLQEDLTGHRLPSSAEPAGPVLPGGGVLHARAPGGQAPAAHGLEGPPQIVLHGQWPERQDDARPLLLAHRQLHPQEEWPPQSEGPPPAPEPAQALPQEQL
ncbi:ras-related protein Rab-40B isoform X2 [Ursus americanus]|uniref:ras-related protein Rab-40B isoform X2 n=1 Tax=Ursus americanus TaxID=9643 RepID=UPI001E67CAE4|nr:ras-related protein Rab-40B isoform X2 [Ursus americanus]